MENTLLEAKQIGPAMLVTGALNPYTLAHEHMAGLAMKHAYGTGHTHFYHGIGASEMKPDAPLTHKQKTKIVSASHGYLKKKHKLPIETSVIPQETSITPFHQIAHLIGRGHRQITVALGSDQMAPGGLKSQIESHMKKHGGFVGLDKKPHKVEIKFHQLGAERYEGEITREAIMKEIASGNLRSVKAGRLRTAIESGDFDFASAMMPESVKNKKAYFDLIAKQQTAIKAAKPVKKKKKITEEFSLEKLENFTKMLAEAQIVRSTIEQRKAKRAKVTSDIKRKHAENMMALMLQQRAQRQALGTSPELRQQQKQIRLQTRGGFINGLKNAMKSIGIDFARKIVNSKVKEVKLGLDKPPRRVGQPKKPRHHTLHEMAQSSEESYDQYQKRLLDRIQSGDISGFDKHDRIHGALAFTKHLSTVYKQNIPLIVRVKLKSGGEQNQQGMRITNMDRKGKTFVGHPVSAGGHASRHGSPVENPVTNVTGLHIGRYSNLNPEDRETLQKLMNMKHIRESFMENLFEQLKKKRKSVASPSKVVRKERTDARAAGRGADPKKKDAIRKQDERREEKKSAQFAVIVRKEGKKNKIKIVRKEDIGKSSVLVKPENFDKNKARRYLDDPNFEITDSSKKLFPEFKRQKGTGKKKTKKKEKQSKKKAKQEKTPKVTNKDPREILPPLPKTPKGGKQKTTPKSQYPDFDHTSLDLEAAIPVILNKMMGVGIDKDLMQKIGEKIKGSETLGASAQRAAQAIVEQFGEVVSVHMGAAKTKITKLWIDSGGTDTTPKTDILLVPKKEWQKAKGDVSKIDMRKAFRCSMKVGDARIINAESGEAAATVEAALQMAGDVASKNKKVKVIIKEIKDAMLDFAKSAELGQFTVDDIRDLVASGQEPEDPKFKKYVALINKQDKLKDLVANKFREVFNISKEFRTALLRESFTGVMKFGENNPACATHCLAMTKDGSNVGIEAIDDEFLDKILPDISIRGAFKGRSWERTGPKGKKEKFRGFSTLFNIDYKRKLHEQNEPEIQQTVERLEPTEDMTYPGATQIVKSELDQIGDNFGLLMKYSDLEPSSLSSNAIDLTDYVNIPARAYNLITIDNNRVVSIPVRDFERFEQQQQEVELMNENSYQVINDFIIENMGNTEALDFMLSSGLVSDKTIQNIVTKLQLQFPQSAYTDLLHEMWENSLIKPNTFQKFVTEARNYRKEYREYHSKPEQRANRSKRVLARRKLMKQGRVAKGDGKDVHHEDGNPQNNGNSNLKVLSKSKNRAIKEEHGAGEVGTDELRKKYIKDTPYAIDPMNVLKKVVKNAIKHK